ncbi:hypothetical protein GP486_008338 [Trichoglossum hirsutum]|uniref:Uncharacterized protein n=1 Tax=Trichoglossum hirsutum TaxID=265104 RepID=A0A9P8L759_9PEZI|nr:hypothetical protein GP486_008338 [Trichoglossum hirsutum]
MHKFAAHSLGCAKCAHPWSVHINGDTLCDRGHQYAQKVALYVYNRAGKAYSRDDGIAPTLIEIPIGCEVVRELLEAMERGLRIRKPPVVTYDRTYPIPPRVVPQPPQQQQQQHRPAQQIIEVVPVPRHTQHSRHVVHRHAGRGSLYDSDMKDRHRRYRDDSSFYSTSSRRYGSRDDMILIDSRHRFYP